MMGVKSTQELTRKQAEDLYAQLQARLNDFARHLTDEQLEDRLERMNDRVNGGEGFANYVIVRGAQT